MTPLGSNVSKLLKPYTHILQVHGKLFRKKIPLAFNQWLKLPEHKLHEITNTVNMLNNGTLLIDDIQDNSELRRTIPAAHRVYGTPLTINCSFHVIALALEKILNLGHPMAANVFCEQTLEITYGQGIDIYWRDNYECPTEAEYKQMAEQKTGGMFVLNVRLMQLFSENKTEYSQLARLLGLYFQIRDDYCNLSHQEALEDWPNANESQDIAKVPFCEDITEGKYSLPIIHALHFTEGREVHNILKKRTRSTALKRQCLDILEQLGSLQYTRDTLLALDKEARTEVARLGGNSDMEKILDEFLSWQNGNAN